MNSPQRGSRKLVCFSALATVAGLTWGLGCSAGGDGGGPSATGAGGSTGATGGQGGTGAGAGTAGAGGVGGIGGVGGTAGAGGNACAQFTAEAQQTPAAMMIVLDRSSSMITGGRWNASREAIIAAVDQDASDGLNIGLLAYPSDPVPSPQCAALLTPTVMCGVPPLEQVPIADVGTDKSNAGSGVRRQIRDWLVGNTPDTTPSDASPGYEAMRVAITKLRSFPLDKGKRLMLFITDGGFSCASLSNRPAYSDGICDDWEEPDSVITLIENARDDATAPVSTFIVGVPGSDSNGQPQGLYFTPPYHMRLALSAYAYAGSPTTVPSNCDGTAFNQMGGDPSVPCHFDMTTGGFDANKLADTISEIRGKALGCTYSRPEPPPGETLDPDLVNVVLGTDSGSVDLKKRSDPNDVCETDGCWDYDDQGEVVLIGKACTDLQGSNSAKVDILVGCKTIIK